MKNRSKTTKVALILAWFSHVVRRVCLSLRTLYGDFVRFRTSYNHSTYVQARNRADTFKNHRKSEFENKIVKYVKSYNKGPFACTRSHDLVTGATKEGGICKTSSVETTNCITECKAYVYHPGTTLTLHRTRT